MTETVVTIDPNRNPQSGQAKQPTANANQQNSEGLSWIKFNIGYFQTLPGIIKIIQLVLGILCMACASPAYTSASHYFLFVAVTSFITSLLWSFAYLLGIREVLTIPINWILTELVNASVTTILYFIAFIVQLIKWSGLDFHWAYGTNIAAGVFGIFNTLAYAAGTYFLYLEHKNGATQ